MHLFYQDTIIMHRILLLISLVLLPLFGKIHHEQPKVEVPAAKPSTASTLYNEMKLEGKVNTKAFELAVAGYEKIADRKRDVLTLIDFSKPSTEERLFVFDMQKKELIYSSVVSHGRNSGNNYATAFSNKNGSYKSSLGFYRTENTYNGKNGYSLVLEGLEKGVNDNARRRAIVMHGAAYANPSVIRNGGRLGRSLGCPALPQKMNRPIIDAIKGGSILYIYAENADYMAQSSILNNKPIS